MDQTVIGFVKDGVIVPSQPLPEGVRVEIHLCAVQVPPELQAEFDAWDRASGETIALVERLAQEQGSDEPR